MTEAKHTPGPWVAAASIASGGAIESVFAGPHGNCILATARDPYQENKAVGEANARLIAAAPDMLDALQGLTRFCEAVRAQVGMGKTQQARLDAARAAIAKATGAP